MTRVGLHPVACSRGSALSVRSIELAMPIRISLDWGACVSHTAVRLCMPHTLSQFPAMLQEQQPPNC